jgi:hypothetical protein
MRFKAYQQGADRTVSGQEHKRAGVDNNRGNAIRTVSGDRRGRAVSKADNKVEASSRDRQVNADSRRVDNRAVRNRVGSRLEINRMGHRADVRLANEVIVVATDEMDRAEI